MRIEAGKITLRSVDIGDVATILQWENDPNLAQYSDPHQIYTEQDIVEFIVEQQRGFEANGQLRLMICLDNHPIGAIDLFNHKGTTAEVGVLIYDNRLRRQGYATQALEQVKRLAPQLGISTLLSTVDEQNRASNRLFERCGFTKIDKNRYRYMKRIVAPSILSADFGNLERDTLMLNRSEAEWVHVDVMDGQFVPNISFGFPVLKAVTKVSTKVIDTHLMIVEPIRYVEQFAKAGSDYVTFHLEAASDVKQCIDAIHNAGAKAGISIKPATAVSALEPYIESVDMVLIMSVEPGFGGQSFIPESLDKAQKLRAMIAAHNTECIIEMDGGISADNAAKVFAAGVDAIVAGSAVFCAENPEAEIVKILNA